MPMPIRKLSTVDEVIDALGGTAAVARLTGGRMQAVSNWRDRGGFPPRTHLLFSQELKAIGCEAPPALWRMKEAV